MPEVKRHQGAVLCDSRSLFALTIALLWNRARRRLWIVRLDLHAFAHHAEREYLTISLCLTARDGKYELAWAVARNGRKLNTLVPYEGTC